MWEILTSSFRSVQLNLYVSYLYLALTTIFNAHLHGYAWGAKHDIALSMLKNEITEPAVLALYDPAGLGAVLLQIASRIMHKL